MSLIGLASIIENGNISYPDMVDITPIEILEKTRKEEDLTLLHQYYLIMKIYLKSYYYENIHHSIISIISERSIQTG